ncbi:T9SS type A sorting domain-containing protein [Adhaeribacter sp. BT258]|uniref:T9SS type A sorting domain-containing protein n=1 Tax=Adhaeribacter terrigena TaxID=2793070 RepID=A0ABS1C2Z6_9BACT|nr:T9SS type A sorting domain-containing protein [Adhaeribacter terrigena]MBK0403710.1 T9SS type A sorting domain-containing protein [Adhaeribacter terrigena]
MIKALLIFLLFFVTTFAQAQTVSSTCSAPDSIIGLYHEDASRLALRKIQANNLPEKDSVAIPATHADTVLHALLAVYNANLAARDTVVSLLNIHTFPSPVMNSIVISAYGNLPWMQQLQLGNMNTGDAYVDHLITQYQLTFDRTFTIFNPIVVLKSGSNYNIRALSNMFETLNGVQYAVPNSYAGDGNNIQDSIYADHVELTYSLGWGDCPSGCINRRFWKFKVYYDCTVEFVGSYGDIFRYFGIKETNSPSLSLYPNPFKDMLSVEGVEGPFNYTLSNVTGQELIKGSATDNQIENLDKLRAGLYLLTIQTKSKTSRFRVYRQ